MASEIYPHFSKTGCYRSTHGAAA